MPGVFWLAVLLLLVVTVFKFSGAMALIKGHAGEWLVRKRLALAVTKALVGLAAIAAFYLITTQLLGGLKDSLPGAAAPARAQPLQQENRAQWEASLLCAYSVDTGRCACFEPNGPKADIPLEQCIELANKGSILAR